MDNRLIFLYCSVTELWGRIDKVWAGNGKPGASRRGAGKGKPSSATQGCDAERKKVAKHMECVPRKAAIVYTVPVPKTDTGGRGENPKADGRSIVKELGKMAP